MQRRALCLAPLMLLAACANPSGAQASDLWFVFLETGRPTPNDPPAVQAMQRGHIQNFKRLFAQGRLLAAGPMADPGKLKRGFVIVRAASLAELQGYFQADDYVREGYMRLNAQPALARAPVHTEGIDDTRIEELRIVLLHRGGDGADQPTAGRQQALLQQLVNQGTVGAWYSLPHGPVAEVLLARGNDDAALKAALAPLADSPAPPAIDIWRQWISPGVVGPRAP